MILLWADDDWNCRTTSARVRLVSEDFEDHLLASIIIIIDLLECPPVTRGVIPLANFIALAILTTGRHVGESVPGNAPRI